MPRRKVKVVTKNDTPMVRTASKKPATRVVVTNDNAKVNTTLTKNEIMARTQRKFATTTSLGMSRIGTDVLDSVGGNFYSPQLSTDFLEKPQNLRERRAFYRFFYNTNEFVGSAIDHHSTIPLSKLRLQPPKTKNKHLATYVYNFFKEMCDNIKLFKTLIEVTHEYWLFGNAWIFAEEQDPFDGLSEPETKKKKQEAIQRNQYLKKNFDIIDKNPVFKGWKKLVVLPPDQVRVRKIPLSDETAVEYLPDADTKKMLANETLMQDPYDNMPKKLDIPADLKEKIQQSGVIPLDTDPNSGSFVFHLARKKSQYEPLGVSIIERCVNTLVLLDKLRQAQTSIASRHMTPMRIIWAEDLADGDVDNLREQVDLALIDPDYSIIANYEIHWEEMGANTRLLDLSAEYESGENRLFAGLSTTREILTGEGSYSGNRISLEIMNTMYLLYREVIQDYVENYLFKPIARKKGFIEYDEYGNEVLIYPKLSFTRLAIRDNETFFDAAFQLYQKGSISIDLILDLHNVDPETTKEKIEADLFTVNDNQFNEMIRNLYTNVSAPLAENTDLSEKLAKYLNLNIKESEEPAEEGVARFSSKKTFNPEQMKKLDKMIRHFAKNPGDLDKMFKGSKNESNKPTS